jgi:hypothetical protein
LPTSRAEAAEIDRREDELYGSERGTRDGRRQALREAKERLEREGEQTSETRLTASSR